MLNILVNHNFPMLYSSQFILCAIQFITCYIVSGAISQICCIAQGTMLCSQGVI